MTPPRTPGGAADDSLRLRRSETLVGLARAAVTAAPGDLVERAEAAIADLLPCDHVDILQLAADGSSLRRLTDHATIETVAPDGQAAFVLASSLPVHVARLRGDDRFVPSPALLQLDVTSGIDAPICIDDAASGIVRAYVTDERAFDAEDIDFVATVAMLVGSGIRRDRRDTALATSEQRLAEAQRVAHFGNFDWDIVSDTVTLSDELSRIVDIEPDAFEGTMDAFLARIHPDDRHVVAQEFQRALRDGDRFRVELRAVRPDGDVRHLATWGEVETDAAGTPIRILGICQDVTEITQAERLVRASERHLKALIDHAPDAVLVLGPDGRIVDANPRASDLLDVPPDRILGAEVARVVDDVSWLRDAREVNVTTQVAQPRPDGSVVPLEVSTTRIAMNDDIAVVAFVRDVTDRQEASRLAQHVREVEEHRQQALEINDNVVQGIAAAIYALEGGQASAAVRALGQTLDAVRAMMTGLLDGTEPPGRIDAGGFVRSRPPVALDLDTALAGPAEDAREAELDATDAPPRAETVRVVLADDSSDIRLLLNTVLSRAGYDVVAEAGNGRDAIEVVERTRPDLLVLDVAMPQLDGLQVIPAVRASRPDTKIIVLSGFDASQMRERVLDVGADAYIEKGTRPSELLSVVSHLFPLADAGARRPLEDSQRLLDDDVAVVVHELRTPVTVIKGMVETLRERIERMPSATVGELLETIQRNTRQLERLLEVFAAAGEVGRGELAIMPEQTDLGALVRESVADITATLGDHPVHVRAPDEVWTQVDPVRVRQVLTNLLSNAAKFSDAGSTITVALETGDEMVDIAVTDTGPGISDADRGRLFAPFERLGRPGRGMGLGLYVSRGIARAHGGELLLARSDETGSTFTLRLPMSQATRSASEHEPRRRPGGA